MIHINNENFEAEVVKSKTLVIIDFFADWCGPCKMMAPVFEELSEEYKGKLKFVKANVDENNDLATKFEISGIPALVLAKNGKEIDRITGFLPKPALKDAIDSLIKGVK